MNKHSEHPIGCSKFAELRPPNCVLDGASGTHSVCVCTYHQNVKLMVDAINLGGLTQGSLKTYQECLNAVVCADPTSSCYLDECTECPGLQPLADILENYFDEASIAEVEYRSWTTTDKAELRTFKMKAYEFVEEFCNKLKVLKPHHFIAKQQSAYYAKRKENLLPGEVLVQLDFSENYAFVAQDAAQSFHYNNDQCTVHPVVYYYCDESVVLRHKSILIR